MKTIYTCPNESCIMHGVKFHMNRKTCWICGCKAKLLHDEDNE